MNESIDLFGEAPADESEATRRPWVVFDTETSDLLNMKKEAHAPGQGRLASITLLYCTPGLTGIKRRRLHIKPEGWQMQPGATKVNGLTTEWLAMHGGPVQDALALWNELITEGYAVAAFNAQFDTKVMRGELRRAGMPDRRPETYQTCIMRKATGVVKARKKDGTIKFPKLEEACAHFKIENTAAHTSLGDSMAALEVLRALDRIGIDITPKVIDWNKPEPTPEEIADACR